MLTNLKLKLALAVGLVAAVTGGVALANGNHGNHGPGRKADMLQKYDANKDGKLDDVERAKLRADMQAKHAAMKAEKLAKYDANKNGKLDPTELATMKSEKQEARFQKLDANKDGKITIDEFKAGQARGGGMRGHRGHHGGRGGAGGGMKPHGFRQGGAPGGSTDTDE